MHASHAACAWSRVAELAGGETEEGQAASKKALTLLDRTPIGPNHLFKSKKQLADHIGNDDDLKVLRGNPEFERFVNDLNGREGPKSVEKR